MPATASSSRLVSTEPKCVSVRDAVATGFRMFVTSEFPELRGAAKYFEWRTLGCLYDSDGARIDLSLRSQPVGDEETVSIDPGCLPAEALSADVPYLSGRTLFLGIFQNHYGHFITESLSRFWWPESAERFDQLVAYPFIHDRGELFVQGFHRHMTNALGIPVDRMTMLHTPMRFQEIVVPEQLWNFDQHANVRARDIYARIATPHMTGGTNGRLFLSRPADPKARLANVAEIEDVFAGFGFKVVYPEELTIDRQLAHYANCEILAGFSGSGMHNCLFTRRGTVTIEVGDTRTPQRPHKVQSIANAVAEIDARFIPFAPVGDRRTDPAQVSAALRGILGERPRLLPVVALRLERAAINWFQPRKALHRRRRYPTRGRRL